MKALLFIFGIITVNFVSAQEGNLKQSSNELKLNIAYSLLGIPELSYERLINEESSLGVSLAFAVERDSYYDFGITPYYRFFFGQKRAAGFFIEANSSVYSQEAQIFETNSSELTFGLGLAFGGKFLTNSGWVGEVYGGFGRNFVNVDVVDWGYPRFGLSIGKRF